MGSHFLHLCFPEDLTIGNSKAAQMSVGVVLVRRERKNGGSCRNMELGRWSGVDKSTDIHCTA